MRVSLQLFGYMVSSTLRRDWINKQTNNPFNFFRMSDWCQGHSLPIPTRIRSWKRSDGWTIARNSSIVVDIMISVEKAASIYWSGRRPAAAFRRQGKPKRNLVFRPPYALWYELSKQAVTELLNHQMKVIALWPYSLILDFGVILSKILLISLWFIILVIGLGLEEKKRK